MATKFLIVFAEMPGTETIDAYVLLQPSILWDGTPHKLFGQTLDTGWGRTHLSPDLPEFVQEEASKHRLTEFKWLHNTTSPNSVDGLADAIHEILKSHSQELKIYTYVGEIE